jgi:hypothetical protein
MSLSSDAVWRTLRSGWPMHSEKWKDMHDGEGRPLAKGPDVILSAACNAQWWSHGRVEHAVASSSRIVYAVTPHSNGRGCL